jgi:hypothetical protein
MKRALIFSNQLVYNYDNPPVELGYSVVQVETQDFPVAEPLFWTDCDDTIIAYQYYWKNGLFHLVPDPPQSEPTQPAGNNGPSVF